MKTIAKPHFGLIAGLALLLCMAWAQGVSAQEWNETPETSLETSLVTSQEALFYSVAITVGVACLSAGYAVGKVGAAALGAAAEKPELLGRALIFVGLAEGIAIYGLIVGIMLIGKIGG
jgi:V/A-type H+-transporting ATPase subunit K